MFKNIVKVNHDWGLLAITFFYVDSFQGKHFKCNLKGNWECHFVGCTLSRVYFTSLSVFVFEK